MKRTIYFVEDDENVNQLIEATLISGGFNALGFLDPELFLEVIKDSRPDLIVLDLMLPKISGFDVLKTLKETPAYADIPVIILSALSSFIGTVASLPKLMGMQEGAINANVYGTTDYLYILLIIRL